MSSHTTPVEDSAAGSGAGHSKILPDRERFSSLESEGSSSGSRATAPTVESTSSESARVEPSVTPICGCQYDDDAPCDDPSCLASRTRPTSSDTAEVALAMDVLAVEHAEGDSATIATESLASDGAIATKERCNSADTGGPPSVDDQCRETPDVQPATGGAGGDVIDSVAAVIDDPSAAPSGFEGPEKVLEMNFKPGVGHERGCRAIALEAWVGILEHAGCSILCSKSNAHFDSYVLSESSLFVYVDKVILKTCGTTTLLLCVPDLLEATRALGCEVEWVSYVRKNFTFPHAQMFPHTSFNDEIKYFQKFFDVGHAYVLGPINSDFWFICVADYCERRSSESTDRTLDIMMFGLDPDVAKMFVKDESFTTSEEVTRRSGIKELMPGADIQEFVFDPCGYSMNGLMYEAYFTIHITPEAEFSYASFETNLRQGSYNALVKRVLAIFKPERFTMTMFADMQGREEMRESPFDDAVIQTGAGAAKSAYARHSVHQAEFEGDYIVQMANYTCKGAVVAPDPGKVELAAAADRQRRRRERLRSWGN